MNNTNSIKNQHKNYELKQRERLAELIDDFCKKELGTNFNTNILEMFASHILADGWMRPPCKAGDIVYYFSKNPINLSVQANTIYEAHVVRIVTTTLGTALVIQIHNEYGVTEIPDINDWGKTVFLTKEEAEEAERRCAGVNEIMKIIDIKHRGTSETRTDGRYPLRIGSEGMFLAEPCVGEIMLYSYIRDNQGQPKDGVLQTSTVQSIERNANKITVTTKNSIYCFEQSRPTEKGGAK